MDALSPDPLRLDVRDLVVRERRAGALVMGVLMDVIALGWLVGPWLVWRGAFWGPAAISVVLGLPLLAIGVSLTRGALRGLRGDHWTLRLGAEHLWLCPRSYLNEVPGRPETRWLRIGLDDVVSARPGEQRTHLPDGDGGRTRVTDRWLDLELAHDAPEALRRAVDDERAAFDGTRFHTFPLEWRGARTLRVYWQSTGLSLAPSRARVLEELGRRVTVHEAGASSEVDSDALTPEQVDALARDLHARGRVIDAVRLLRVERGWTLAHARSWLREDEAA